MIRKKFDELRLTGSLPSPSTVGLRILDITKDDNYDQTELERSIQADPALSGRVLKLANSAGQAPVSDVSAAARRLGSETVRSVALGFTLIADNRNGASEAFDYDGYWSHSLALATAANAFANEVAGIHPADGFTCALLLDVGQLALASVHPDRYSYLLKAAPGVKGRRLAELESQAFDIDHYEVAAAMLADWGLPEGFQQAALFHDREDVVLDIPEEEALVRLLRACKPVADVLVLADTCPPMEATRTLLRLGHAAEELGIELERFLAGCDAVALAWQDWSGLLGVDVSNLGSIRDRYHNAVASQAPAPRPSNESIIDNTSLERAISPPSVSEQSHAARSTLEGPTRILLIDDDERMLKLISHHLRKEGYEVMTSDSSQEGLTLALERQPQLVITDWMMPGTTGLELCSILRQSEAGRRMYVLVVTAREDDERVVEAFAAGADDYIVKPFNPRILLARVRAGERVVQLREQVEEAKSQSLAQVAELGIMTRKLRAAAMTDPLTELPNRRYAMKRLKQEWDSALRLGRPLSVVMADIDHFKSINDRFGHDAGDAVLRQVADLLKRIARSGDVLARIGGEEFLSIDMGSNANDAALGAERLREAIQALAIEHPGFEGNITLSLGVAERTRDMATFDDLIKAADEALYAAKAAGRNCVSVSERRSGQDRRAS